MWPEERDARLYDGPWPVVAHPTCAPWSVARALSSGAERDCAPRAVEQVRRWGGVLEHPAHSSLWAHMGLPRPGDVPDAWGGVSVAVEQARWGHEARKPTWLYLVRAWLPPIPSGELPADLPGVFELGAEQARRTPPAFARWLVAAASGRDGFPIEGSDGYAPAPGDG